MGVHAEDLLHLDTRNNQFLGATNARTAIEAFQVRFLSLDDSEISGYLNNSLPQGNHPGVINGAVDLYAVEYATVSGSYLHDNGTAIATINDLGGAPLKTNVYIRNRSRINANDVGVYVQSGGVDPVGLDWGLVNMSCSDMEDNRIAGVLGRDVLLEVDAYAQQTNTGEPRTNNFNDDAGRLFDICLDERLTDYPFNDDSSQPWLYKVPMTGNYWGVDNPDPTQVDMSFLTDNCSQNLGIYLARDFDPTADQRLTTCPTNVIGGEVPPTTSEPTPDLKRECIIVINGEERLIHAQYVAAWQALLNSGVGQPSVDFFAPIAALIDQQIARAYSSQGDEEGAPAFEVTESACKHYRAVAQVLAGGSPVGENERLGAVTPEELLDPYWVAAARGERVSIPLELEDFDIQLLPNPATTAFQLQETAEGRAYYRCLDLMGREIAAGTFDVQVWIPTSDWTPGVYSVEVRFEQGGLPRVLPLVIARP